MVNPNKTKQNFNNPALLVQTWYCLARSKEIGRAQIKVFKLPGRPVALYRTQNGILYALDARCGHLGANLRHGQVVGDQIACAFHHWRFGPDGACRYAPGLRETPGRKIRAYPVQERWGLIWLFNGPHPLFPLPKLGLEQRYYTIRLPGQYIRCHPHVVLANGLDTAHFEPLHQVRLSSPPTLATDEPYQLSLTLRGEPLSPIVRRLLGRTGSDIQATFSTIGSSLAWVTVRKPIHFQLLFSGRPSTEGGCHTQTLFFFPQRPGLAWLQALIIMYTLLYADHRILDDIEFRPAFAESDSFLKEFVELVNRMPVW